MSRVASKVFSVKENSVVTKVGMTFRAVIAFVARVPDGTDSNPITNFEERNAGSDSGNLSNYFMAWTAGVITRSPILSYGSKVRMADRCVEHFEPDFMWFQFQKSVRVHYER